MKKLFNLFMAGTLLAASPFVHAGAEDDPVLAMLKLDQLEKRFGDEDPLVAEGYLWIGKDLDKLWINFDLEHNAGRLEELGTQVLYSHAVAPYWDVQVGWGRDHKPSDQTRDWLVVGFEGVAPYEFEVETQLMLGRNGQTRLGLSAEYEVMFTQKLVLIPEVDLTLYGKDDNALDIGAGLSSGSVGLRLAYEFKREFAPYVGINWSRKFGGTADRARAGGEIVSDTQLVAGLRAWF